VTDGFEFVQRLRELRVASDRVPNLRLLAVPIPGNRHPAAMGRRGHEVWRRSVG